MVPGLSLLKITAEIKDCNCNEEALFFNVMVNVSKVVYKMNKPIRVCSLYLQKTRFL